MLDRFAVPKEGDTLAIHLLSLCAAWQPPTRSNNKGRMERF